ncbi:MAG: type II secretion system protein GspC, partial [Myxococcota bacterium]
MSSQRERRTTVGIILGTLALSALFLAQGTTRLIAASVFGGEGAEHLTSGPKGPAPAASAIRERTNPDPILQKNIFDSESGDLTKEPVSEEELLAEEEDTDEGMTVPENDADVGVCSGGAKLVATIVAPRSPDWSFAAMNADGKALLYRAGMEVGDHTLVGIRSDRVYMAPTDGELCKLQMFAPEAQPNEPATAKAKAKDDDDRRRKVARRLRGGKDGPISDEELEQGIQKVSDTEFNVQQSLVTKILENQSELMRSARIIPHEEGGRTVGVKLYGIRRNSVLGKLGVQNGDTLRNINGFDMTSPDSALQAYTKLRDADN